MVGTANDLNIAQSGYVVHNGSGVFFGRTFQAGTGITITNPDGVAGNSTISSTASTTDLHVAKWIVNNVPNSGGNQTTIQNAINAASPGDTIFVMPGSTGIYTENFTLPPNINLTSFQGDQSTPHVTIVGKITMSGAGTSTISNIRLQTNSDFSIVVSGNSASILNLNNCFLNMTNNTGISFTSSSSSAKILVYQCMGNLGTTGIAIYASSSAGVLNFQYSTFSNLGASTTANTVSAGLVDSFFSAFKNPSTSSGTSTFDALSCQFDTASQNVTSLTIGGSGNGVLINCTIASGTASSISISSSASILDSSIASSNSNVITGAGSLSFSGLTLPNNSNINTTLTLTPGVIKGGFYQGNLTNTAPPAGMIGEIITNTGTSVNLPNNTPTNITSIVLSAGVWDVSGMCAFSMNGANTSQTLYISPNSASNTGAVVGLNTSLNQFIISNATLTFNVMPQRVVTTGQTYYLVATAVFSTSTTAGSGKISATRVA